MSAVHVTSHESLTQAAVEYEAEIVRRTGLPSEYIDRRNRELLAATEGLDLSSREWSLLAWFLSWDSQEVLAAVIRKAREQGGVES